MLGWLLLSASLAPGSARALSPRVGLDLPALRAPRWERESSPEPASPPPRLQPLQPAAQLVGEAAAPSPGPGPSEDPIRIVPVYRRAWDGITLGAQLGLEITSTGLAVLTGLAVGGIVSAFTWDWRSAYLAGFLTGAILQVILHPLAAYAGGRLADGRGTFWGALLGHLLGMGVATGFTALALSTWDPGRVIFLAVMAGLSFYTGPIVGYHISHRILHPEAPRTRRATPGRTSRLQALREHQAPHLPARQPRWFPLLRISL